MIINFYRPNLLFKILTMKSTGNIWWVKISSHINYCWIRPLYSRVKNFWVRRGHNIIGNQLTNLKLTYYVLVSTIRIGTYVVYRYVLRKSILVPFLCIRTQPAFFCSLIQPWSKVFQIVQYILSQNCVFCDTNFFFVLGPWSK